mmetsp:Transcript_12419/g.45270  ORF Transcript_12419/g.45270 Transcript_12419/m.45270 type:complete len:205 (+) Transcript_12419:270-884(+)
MQRETGRRETKRKKRVAARATVPAIQMRQKATQIVILRATPRPPLTQMTRVPKMKARMRRKNAWSALGLLVRRDTNGYRRRWRIEAGMNYDPQSAAFWATLILARRNCWIGSATLMYKTVKRVVLPNRLVPPTCQWMTSRKGQSTWKRRSRRSSTCQAFLLLILLATNPSRTCAHVDQVSVILRSLLLTLCMGWSNRLLSQLIF